MFLHFKASLLDLLQLILPLGGFTPSPSPCRSPSLSSPPPSRSHPSDEKEHSSPFPRNISAASLGSLITHHHSANHIHQPEPSVTDPLMGAVHSMGDLESRIDMEKNELQVGLPPRRSRESSSPAFTSSIDQSVSSSVKVFSCQIMHHKVDKNKNTFAVDNENPPYSLQIHQPPSYQYVRNSHDVIQISGT